MLFGLSKPPVSEVHHCEVLERPPRTFAFNAYLKSISAVSQLVHKVSSPTVTVSNDRVEDVYRKYFQRKDFKASD